MVFWRPCVRIPVEPGILHIENIVEKGEIAHFELFHLFTQSLPKTFSSMGIFGGTI